MIPPIITRQHRISSNKLFLVIPKNSDEPKIPCLKEIAGTLRNKKSGSNPEKRTIKPKMEEGINKIQPIRLKLEGNKNEIFIIFCSELVNFVLHNDKYTLHFVKRKLLFNYSILFKKN